MPEKLDLHNKTDESAHTKKELVAVGCIVKSRGLKGELKVKSLSNIPERITMLRDVFVEFADGSIENHSITSSKQTGKQVVITFEGVNDRDAADIFRGAYICIDKESVAELPADNFYEFDLLGMDVRNTEDVIIGTVVRIEQYPANDVIIVDMNKGEVMVPAVKGYVLDVNSDENYLKMDIPDDLPVYPKGKK